MESFTILHNIQRIFLNILDNFKFLQEDFKSISFNTSGILFVIINYIFVISLILIFYLVGRKIKSIFFKKKYETLDFFIDIALGYISIASCILVFGILGILYNYIIHIYLIVLLIVALYPLDTLRKRLHFISVVFSEYCDQFSKYKMANIIILGFVMIAFLRLIPPETGVDAIWYHTDYPNLYLKTHSMMNIDPKGKYYPAVVPALSDMLNIITQSISLKDSSRYLHFGFYFLVVVLSLVVFKKKYPFIAFAVLLFVTSPVIIRHSSTAYAEFEWIFCWLLAVFIITSKDRLSFINTTLSALLFGGALATKLWILPFYGVFLTYIIILNIKEKKTHLLKLLIIFIVFSFLIPFLWYLRAFLITGNPLFPTFWTYPNGEPNNPLGSLFALESIKIRTEGLIIILSNISPFSIPGLIFLFQVSLKSKRIKFNSYPLVIFGIILSIFQFIINYSWHRFVVPFYSVIVVFLALGIEKFVNLNKYSRYGFYISCLFLFLYYLTNTLLILPYGFGWADKNKYLTRILSRDNSSYFDYNYKFSKNVNTVDKVAVYGLWGFYYADFDYVYVEEVFKNKRHSLQTLIENGTTKILIKGGDIGWFCKEINLPDCKKIKTTLLAKQIFDYSPMSLYLYRIAK